MLDSFGRLYLLLGPLIIIAIGIIVIILLGTKLSGPKRWLMLFCSPLVILLTVLLTTYIVINVVDPSEGSGFLLGGSTIALYFTGLIGYYPLIIIVAMVRYFKK